MWLCVGRVWRANVGTLFARKARLAWGRVARTALLRFPLRVRGGLEESPRTLGAVGREGQGNAAANLAWRAGADNDARHLAGVLEAMGGVS